MLILNVVAYLCLVDEDSPVLPAVLGPDDGLGLHGKMVHTMVVPVMVQDVAFGSPRGYAKEDVD